MKTRIAIAIVLLLAASVALWAFVQERSTPSSEPPPQSAAEPPERASGETPRKESPQNDTPLLDVDHFMQNVDDFPDTVRVKGVVAARDATTGMLTLIDAAEFESCGTITCAALALPVLWSNHMPELADTVVVTGAVRESDGKLVFVADNLDPLTDGPETPG